MTESIRCCDGCGRSVLDESAEQAKGWSCLQITCRYRCPACVHELAQANRLDDSQVAGMDSTMQPLEPKGRA